MRLDDLAGRLEATGDALAGASTTMSLIDPGSAALGGETPGGLGELGRYLHRDLTTALTCRGREALTHAARLADAAAGVRSTAAGYRAVDDGARHRNPSG